MDKYEWYFTHNFVDMDNTSIFYGFLFCKYCYCVITKNGQSLFNPKKCISEDEKIIKDIIE